MIRLRRSLGRGIERRRKHPRPLDYEAPPDSIDPRECYKDYRSRPDPVRMIIIAVSTFLALLFLYLYFVRQ